MHALVSRVDLIAQRLLGMPYLRLTRGYDIHDRCRYLLQVVGEIAHPPCLDILDVGCGSGLALRYLGRHAQGRVNRYLGIDMRAERLRRRYADVRVPHAFADVNLDSDWSYGQFDLVWCAEVIEHLIDDRALFSKLARSVRSGGTLVLTAPSLAFIQAMGRHVPSLLEVRPVQDGGHVRQGYAPDDLRRFAADNGLQLKRLDGITRTPLDRVRRRYCGGPLHFVVANATSERGRAAKDVFALGPDFAGREAEFWSIAAVFRR
jgi:2-polyprenyl-3-methyl-5-hydroxy-6-metoxy-1,4-benzoquinol methylase